MIFKISKYILIYILIQLIIVDLYSNEDLKSFLIKGIENQYKGTCMQMTIDQKILKYGYRDTVKSQVEIIQKDSSIVSINEDITLYVNPKTIINIIHSEKKIIVMDNPNKTISNEYSMDQITTQIESFIKICNLDTSFYTANSLNYKFTFANKVVNEMQGAKISLSIDTTSGFVKEYSIFLPNGINYSYLSTTFRSINPDFTTNMFDSPFINQVLDSNNRLLSKYQNYTLEDNRNYFQTKR